ncbi:polysaccharide pyruvyl transferase family protein [Pseudalkalibacillus hwajinpoensis]|uniref:polysaccharide pyruvyl transferase family protein n=1 Tax=Guptibacillus hwajinpoensis TaxID=208199 RepID=UPI00325C2EF8
MKILMLFHGGSLNRGCEAIVRSSVEMIKERIPNSKVFLVSDMPETDNVITKLDGIFDGRNDRIKKYSYEWFFSSIKVKVFNDESYALGKIHNNVIKHINEADVCLSIGGDNYCYGEQPGWYEINKRVRASGKKLVLWGCSIGEEDMSDRKLEDLKLYDLILARETLTYNMLVNLGLENVKLCADPAFTMESEELPLPEGFIEGNTIGLNYSPLVMKRNAKSYGALSQLITHILRSTDMTIALTPHVIAEGNNDYEVLYRFYNEFESSGRVIILPDNLTAPQYKGYISRMRFFIGARTHATIAAYSSFVPTMVLGYSVKSKGIAKDIFGEEKLVMGINDISDVNKIISSFDELVKSEEEMKTTLNRSIPSIKHMSYTSVNQLTNLFSMV